MKEPIFFFFFLPCKMCTENLWMPELKLQNKSCPVLMGCFRLSECMKHNYFSITSHLLTTICSLCPELLGRTPCFSHKQWHGLQDGITLWSECQGEKYLNAFLHVLCLCPCCSCFSSTTLLGK